MLRSVFTIINLFFVLIIYSQSTPIQPSQIGASNLSSQPEFNSENAIKLNLSTSSYFYDAGEPILCNLMIVDAETLQPIYYSLTSKISMLNSRGEKVFERTFESSQGILNVRIDTAYFRKGGEYTILAESGLGNKKVKAQRHVIIQETIRADMYFDVKTQKEQYVPEDTINMTIALTNKYGTKLKYYHLLIIEIYDDLRMDTIELFSNNQVYSNFKRIINKNYKLNNLAYQIKVLVDGDWQSHFERIQLNAGQLVVKTFFENGYYKVGKKNAVVLISTNSFGELVKAKFTALNLKTMDSFEILCNDYGIGRFVLPIGDSIQDYILFSNQDRKRFNHLFSQQESCIKLSISNKNEQSIRFDISSELVQIGRLVCHIRGSVICDTLLKLSPMNQTITLLTKAQAPGILQAVVLNSNNEVLAQKLSVINRHKHLKFEAKVDETTNANGDRILKLKVKDEENKPVLGIFNISITDQQNNLIIEDKQSRIMENLLYESDLHYPVADIGKLWKCRVINNDSLIDLFLNGCELNEMYLPKIINKKGIALQYFYQLILQRRDLQNDISLNSAVKKVVIISKRGRYKTTLNNRNEIFIPVDSIEFPCRLAVFGRIKEKIYFDETYVKLVFKATNQAGFANLGKDTFTTIGGSLSKLQNPLYEISAKPIMDDADDERSYTRTSSCCRVVTRSALVQTGLKGFSALAGLSSGITTTSSGLSGRGSRTDGTAIYIDGVRVISPSDVPNSSENYLPYQSMGYGGSGSSQYVYSYPYSYYRSNYSSTNQYSIKKYRPNGSSLFDFPQYTYQYNSQKVKDKITTYFWQTGIQTNAIGEYSCYVKVPEKTMVYHLCIEGISKKSNCAEFDTSFALQTPIFMSVKAPRRISSKDTVDIVCTIYNNTKMYKSLRMDADLTYDRKLEKFQLNPGEFKNIVFRFSSMSNSELSFKLYENYTNLLVHAIDKPILVEDNLIKVQNLNNLDNHKEQIFDVSEKTSKFNAIVTVYKNQADHLFDKMVRILREPNGCFEQVSSSNYPNILAYKFLQNHASEDYSQGQFEVQRGYLLSGYRKLVNYETKEGGFSWYGDGKGNEALTAMGLLQFKKLGSCGIAIDSALVTRSINWLYKSRNGKGVFIQSSGRYGFANTSQSVAHAYVTYVLSEIGETNLNASIEQINQQLNVNSNFYNEALLFAIYLKQNEFEKANLLYEKISKKSNLLMQETTSKTVISTIVNSSYKAALNESLCIIANSIFASKQKKYMSLANSIGAYIQAQDFYSLGNMQTEAMALETMNHFNGNIQLSKLTKLNLRINEQLVEFDILGLGNKVINLNNYVKKGKNKIRLLGDSLGSVHTELEVCNFFKTALPVSTDEDLKLKVNYTSNKVKLGDIVNFKIEITNTSNAILPQTIAIVPLPGGVNILTSELLNLKKQGYFDYFEVVDGKIILYFEEINSLQKINFNLPLICELKGQFETSASVIYKYYRAQQKSYCKSDKLIIE